MFLIFARKCVLVSLTPSILTEFILFFSHPQVPRSVLANVLEWIVTITILYFLLTIINSLAQQNVTRSQQTSPKKKGRRRKVQ